MNEERFLFWQRWLSYANGIALLLGLLVAFAGNSFLFEYHNFFTRDVFFQGLPLGPGLLAFKNWLFGIIGGTIVGFHFLMIMISENAFKKKEKWAFTAMSIALLSWFVIDSGISIYYGAIYNVVLINLGALIMIGIPLIMCRKEFY